MHVADPERALREMIRATRPGGLVLAVEPSNMRKWASSAA
jgi:ubiquinone/menaquinone biosynthesis C-methylase UbiE